MMIRRTIDPDRDIDYYTRHDEEECTCNRCERTLKNERVYNYYGTYYCIECFDEKYGEEV